MPLLHTLHNQNSYDFLTGQLAGPIDLLTKRCQAKIHAGIACVQQDAGHGEFSGSLFFAERFQIVLRQLTQAVGQKYNVGILKIGVHELDRLIQGRFEIRAAVEECLGGIEFIRIVALDKGDGTQFVADAENLATNPEYKFQLVMSGTEEGQTTRFYIREAEFYDNSELLMLTYGAKETVVVNIYGKFDLKQVARLSTIRPKK